MSTFADQHAIRALEFPISERYIYLNHAALGPLPRRTADTMTAFVADFRDKGVLAESTWLPVVERTRSLVAQLLHCGGDEIAFTKNTSQGLGIVASGIPWRRGDVVVTVRGEFPANVYPWMALQRQGVEVRFVELRHGQIMMEDLRAALRGARLLAISWVQYSTGQRIDLAAISSMCREMGVLFSLDAIQGVGALPIDLGATPVDFCAFGGHKWLLGPQGVGVLYVRRDIRDLLLPTNVGWLGVEWQDYAAFDYDRPLKETAGRYEEGTRSLIGLAGLEQSVRLLLEVGQEQIEQHLVTLIDATIQQLGEKGYRVLTPWPTALRSGIIAIAHPQIPAQALLDQLRQARIVAAVREGGVRLSPHLYNTLDEMHEVVDVLGKV
ncbi:MAG: aminotransferase class V-fold PLP-dependent enzyme [Herpetosiphon sp.]